MVHMASVWVPFTSESKEAIASYPEIQKELRLALQSVGRKLGMYLRRRLKVKQEGERRNIFLRYLGEVATAVSEINQCRPQEAVRPAAAGRQEEDGHGRREARRARQSGRRRATASWKSDPNVLIVENRQRIRHSQSGKQAMAKKSRKAGRKAPTAAAPAKAASDRRATRRRSRTWSAWPIASSTMRRRSATRTSTSPPARCRTCATTRRSGSSRWARTRTAAQLFNLSQAKSYMQTRAGGQRLQATDRPGQDDQHPRSVLPAQAHDRGHARKRRSTTRPNATR